MDLGRGAARYVTSRSHSYYAPLILFLAPGCASAQQPAWLRAPGSRQYAHDAALGHRRYRKRRCSPPPPSRIHRPRGQQASNYYRAQGRGAAGHDGVCGQYIPIGRSCRDAWIPRHSRTESIVDGAEGGGGGSTPILDTMRILTAASHGLKNPVQAARKQPSTGTWRTVFSAPPPRCERVRCGYSAGRGSICRQHCRRAGRDQAGLGYTRPFLWARRRHTRDGVYGGGRHSTKRHRRGRIGSQGTWQADAELLSLTIAGSGRRIRSVGKLHK